MASEIGASFAICVVLGCLGGIWLDGLLKSSPFGAICGMMLGMGIGMALMVKRSNQIDKQGKTASPQASAEPLGEAGNEHTQEAK
jgi:F0F1-type ATP synthase assembly protein I